MKSNAATTARTVILKEAQATEGSQEILRYAQDDTACCDRLSAANNFANELNESRLWKIKISYQKRWTTHRRAQKRVEIQITKPWQRSTGPRTEAGKTRTRYNAGRPDPGAKAMKHALRLHRRFLQAIHLYARMRKCGHPDTKSFAKHCNHLCSAATRALIAALLISGYDFRTLIKFPA